MNLNDLMIPTVHLNGTGREALEAELREAIDAVAAATKALDNMTVHGRDYYPQGSDAIYRAMDQQQARRDALWGVRNELCTILNKVIGPQLAGGHQLA